MTTTQLTTSTEVQKSKKSRGAAQKKPRSPKQRRQRRLKVLPRRCCSGQVSRICGSYSSGSTIKTCKTEDWLACLSTFVIANKLQQNKEGKEGKDQEVAGFSRGRHSKEKKSRAPISSFCVNWSSKMFLPSSGICGSSQRCFMRWNIAYTIPAPELTRG